MLFVPSSNLFFPLNHKQWTCLTLCKEGAQWTSHPGVECQQRGDKSVNVLTQLKHMLARHSSNNQLSLNVSGGAFRVEMGLKNAFPSNDSQLTTTVSSRPQLFFIYNAKKRSLVVHFTHMCPHSIIYSSEYFTWTEYTRDWNMLTAFKCGVMMEVHFIAVTANFPFH